MPETYPGKDYSSEDNPDVQKRNEAYLAGFRKSEITQRDKDNLVQVMDKLSELADSVEKVPSMNWDRMGSMFRSVTGALGGGMGGMMMGAMAPSMGMMQGAFGTIGMGMSQVMAPSAVMVQKFMGDMVRPMIDFTARYQTGAAIGGLVGMAGGAVAGGFAGGMTGAMFGMQALGTVGSYIGAGIEMAFTGVAPAQISAWNMAIQREATKFVSAGYGAQAAAAKIIQNYANNDEFWEGLQDLLGVTLTGPKANMIRQGQIWLARWIQANIIASVQQQPPETRQPRGRPPNRRPPNRRIM